MSNSKEFQVFSSALSQNKMSNRLLQRITVDGTPQNQYSFSKLNKQPQPCSCYFFHFLNFAQKIGLRAVLRVLDNMFAQQWFNAETCTNFWTVITLIN